jgi:NAD(P)-dependent dehydrogenase (short-subunit alcohol dehydrogenase family)
VNCAGIAPSLQIVRRGAPHCLDALAHILQVNITGTFLPITRFVKRLQKVKSIGEETGVIINTSSITAFDGQAGQAAYAATKGAITSMTLPLARELSRQKIRVMTVAPGIFDTPMLENLPRKDELGTQVPHPSRLGAPNEFASLARHIIENPMMNGEVIRLDGALRMMPS